MVIKKVVGFYDLTTP